MTGILESSAAADANRSAPAGVIAVALIGRGILGSASPLIHEREAHNLGLALTYRLVDFDAVGLNERDLPFVLDLLASMGFAGVNITHPFKQVVMPLLDEIDSATAQIGAVNTVQFEDGKKRGFNTDVAGFRWLMESDLPGAELDRVAQIGAGGAGSAACHALLQMGAREIVLYDNNQGRAEALAERVKSSFADFRISVGQSASHAVRSASGVVQTTPIGMDAHPGVPVDPSVLDPAQWLADVIYFPRRTELVLAADRMGLRAVGGASMVIGQAAEAFRLFTGVQPDLRRMVSQFNANERAIP